MKRRIAIRSILGSGILLSASNTFSFGQRRSSKKEIGLQLYSVRKEIDKASETEYVANFVTVLKKIADMGYTGVEAANYNSGKFYRQTPSEFKKNVESVGMKVVSSHTMKKLTTEEVASGNFQESLSWWDQCIDAHIAAGMKYIVCPAISMPNTMKELDLQCKYLDAIGAKCRAKGLLFGYHNHSFEFKKVEDKEVMLDYMITHTRPENVCFQLDVYWAVMGAVSPVEYFNKYPNRFTLFHIKDHKEIGQSGMVGFDAIFKNASTAGVKHIFVELEGAKSDIFTGLKISIDYLQNASFVKDSYSK